MPHDIPPTDRAALVESSIRSLWPSKATLVVAIDGRCASGKTTLAAALAERLNGLIFHMDDFFLRPEQRTPERLATPGENVDHERFFDEVLRPLRNGRPLTYRPYDCHACTLLAPVTIDPSQTRLILVEGSYSCHPYLWPFYDLRVFSDISPDLQAERIRARNGAEMAKRFAERWIPLEEAYFTAYDLRNRCDLYLPAT